VIFNLFCEELYRFLITGSKDKGCDITTKLFYYNSLIPIHYRFTNSEIYFAVLSERAAKIGLYFFLPNLF